MLSFHSCVTKDKKRGEALKYVLDRLRNQWQMPTRKCDTIRHSIAKHLIEDCITRFTGSPIHWSTASVSKYFAFFVYILQLRASKSRHKVNILFLLTFIFIFIKMYSNQSIVESIFVVDNGIALLIYCLCRRISQTLCLHSQLREGGVHNAIGVRKYEKFLMKSALLSECN